MLFVNYISVGLENKKTLREKENKMKETSAYIVVEAK